uniref:Rhs family protein n=1 Tax=Mycobacterium sp. (strain JS330) TaxID=1004011 RepID=F4ZCI6_MYCS0|nr:Rhs family protein [Mycobacterium sp. JS330]
MTVIPDSISAVLSRIGMCRRSPSGAQSTHSRSGSAADGTHGTNRLDEPVGVHGVTGELSQHGRPPGVDDFVLAATSAKYRAQVSFLLAEQTTADLAVGGQSRAITCPTERVGNRTHDADPSGPPSTKTPRPVLIRVVPVHATSEMYCRGAAGSRPRRSSRTGSIAAVRRAASVR